MPIFWIVMLLSILLDQFSKYYVSHHLPYLHAVPVIPGWFNLTYVHNFGAAFSMLQNQRWLFVSVALVAVTAIVIFRRRFAGDWLTQVSLGLVVAGTLGNMIDRIRVGYVVDFLDFHMTTIFNVADAALTVGMVFFAWQILFEEQRKGKSTPEQVAGTPGMVEGMEATAMGMVMAMENVESLAEDHPDSIVAGELATNGQELGSEAMTEPDLVNGFDVSVESSEHLTSESTGQ